MSAAAPKCEGMISEGVFRGVHGDMSQSGITQLTFLKGYRQIGREMLNTIRQKNSLSGITLCFP